MTFLVLDTQVPFLRHYLGYYGNGSFSVSKHQSTGCSRSSFKQEPLRDRQVALFEVDGGDRCLLNVGK